EVATEAADPLQFFRAQDLAAVGSVRIVPPQPRDHPVVHADVQIADNEDRRLESFGDVEGGGREVEALPRISREEEDVLRVAVRGKGASEQIRLLSAGGHSRGRTRAL